MKKIGFYNIEFPSKGCFQETSTACTGGAGSSLYDFLTELNLKKYKCTIFSIGDKKQTQEESKGDNLILYRSPTIGALLQNNKKPFKVLPSPNYFRISLNHNFDLIQCWLGFPGSEIPALYYKHKKDVPFVLSIRGAPKVDWGSKKRQLAMKLYVETIYKQAMKECDVIHIPSKGLIEDYPFLKSNDYKIHVIPNGVDYAFYSKDNHEVLTTPYLDDFNRFDKNLLFVGSLVGGKGIKTLIKAFETVLEDDPSIGLIIVGKGPLESYIKERAKQGGYSKNILMTGFISNQDELANIYSYADLFVFPSLSETFGRVVLESMAAGTPCLVSDIGVLMDVIDNGSLGLYAKVNDPESFSNQISEFFEMNDNERRRLEKKGIENAKKHSWRNVARQIEEIYEGLLE